MNRLLRVLGVVAVAVLFVSCSGDAAVQITEEATEPAVADAADAADEPAPSEGEVTAQPSASSSGGEPRTLDEYLGVAAGAIRAGDGGGPGFNARSFDQDQLLEQQRAIQVEIQRCMQEQGFEYTPEEVGDGLRAFLAAGSSTLSEAEYAQTEGFGISTAFDAVLEGDIDLTESTNPNDEYLATLSDGEADAWQLALQGQPPVRNEQGQLIDPQTGEVVQGRGQRGGCTGDAEAAVRGDFSILEDLADEFAELDDRIASDPRITEINRAWIDCMSAAGFDYQDESEARDEISSQLRPFLRSLFQSAAPGAAGQQAGQGPAPGGGNRLAAIAGVELTDQQEADLAALQTLERTVAVASLECKGDTGVEIEEITARYEAEFVVANREVLEAFSS